MHNFDIMHTPKIINAYYIISRLGPKQYSGFKMVVFPFDFVNSELFDLSIKHERILASIVRVQICNAIAQAFDFICFILRVALHLTIDFEIAEDLYLLANTSCEDVVIRTDLRNSTCHGRRIFSRAVGSPLIRSVLRALPSLPSRLFFGK